MTQQKLSRLCRLWQKRLRLSDWEISVRLVTEEEMPDELGIVDDRDEEEMRAEIKVRDFAESESTLVHELIHVRLLPFGVGGTVNQETAVNLLADCYMRAYQRGKRD